MFTTSTLKFSRLADIPMGNLVYRPLEDELLLGMIAQSPSHHTEVHGVLFFGAPAGGTPPKTLPTFDSSNLSGYAIDLGMKAEVVWSGGAAALAKPVPHNELPRGHVAVVGGRTGLSARVYGGPTPDFPPYWEFSSGELFPSFDMREAVYLTGWTIGARDEWNKFHPLFAYPAT